MTPPAPPSDSLRGDRTPRTTLITARATTTAIAISRGSIVYRLGINRSGGKTTPACSNFSANVGRMPVAAWYPTTCPSSDHAGLLELEQVLQGHDLSFHAGALSDVRDTTHTVAWRDKLNQHVQRRRRSVLGWRGRAGPGWPSAPCSRYGPGRHAVSSRGPSRATLRDPCSSRSTCRRPPGLGPRR